MSHINNTISNPEAVRSPAGTATGSHGILGNRARIIACCHEELRSSFCIVNRLYRRRYYYSINKVSRAALLVVYTCTTTFLHATPLGGLHSSLDGNTGRLQLLIHGHTTSLVVVLSNNFDSMTVWNLKPCQFQFPIAGHEGSTLVLRGQQSSQVDRVNRQADKSPEA